MKPSHKALLIATLIAIYLVICDSKNLRVEYLPMFIGLFLSLYGLTEIFLKVVKTEKLQASLLPWILVFLCGLLLLSQNWLIALSLAGIVIAAIFKNGFGADDGGQGGSQG